MSQQAAIDLRRCDQPERIRTEQPAVRGRRQSKEVDEHRRRAGDVREHAGLRETARERVTNESTVPQQTCVAGGRAEHAIRCARVMPARLRQPDGDTEQTQNAEAGEHPEDRSPSEPDQ